jgi:hypothetical protein
MYIVHFTFFNISSLDILLISRPQTGVLYLILSDDITCLTQLSLLDQLTGVCIGLPVSVSVQPDNRVGPYRERVWLHHVTISTNFRSYSCVKTPFVNCYFRCLCGNL